MKKQKYDNPLRQAEIALLYLLLVIFLSLVPLKGCVNSEWAKHDTHFKSADHAYFSTLDTKNPQKYVEKSKKEDWWGQGVSVK